MTDEAVGKTDAQIVETVCGVLYVLLLPVWLLWSGFVLQKLWTWFAVPVGAPVLTLAQAIGLGLIASFMTARARRKAVPAVNLFLFEAVTPGLFLAIGWFVMKVFA